VVLVSFLEDHIPTFILVVIQEIETERVEFRILKLSKNKEELKRSTHDIKDKLNVEESTKNYIV
jgi:hypothetical protein